jgi:predicted RNase H-like HicB family nuclease
MDTTKYTIEIFYSEEDEGYIAIVPDLPGCSAFGETREKTLEEIKIAMKLWIEVASEDNEIIPAAKSKVA